MTWASACLKSSLTFSRPRPPAPTRATLTLSLGGTKPLPPRTCRGTMVKTAAAVAPALRKERRGGRSVWVMGSCLSHETLPVGPASRRSLPDRRDAGPTGSTEPLRLLLGSRQFPPRPVLPVDERVRLRAVPRLQVHRVPLQFLPGPVGDIAQVVRLGQRAGVVEVAGR